VFVVGDLHRVVEVATRAMMVIEMGIELSLGFLDLAGTRFRDDDMRDHARSRVQVVGNE